MRSFGTHSAQTFLQTMLCTLATKTPNSWAVTLLCLSSLKRTPAWHAMSSMVVDVTVKPAARQHVSCHWRHFTAELFYLINIPVKIQLLYHLWDPLSPSVHTLFRNSAGGEHCTLHREMSRFWTTLVSLMHLSSLITGICMTHMVICLGIRIVTCCPRVLPWLKALHHIHTCFCDLTCVPYTFTNWLWILKEQNLSHAQSETRCVLPTLHTVSGSPGIFKLTSWWCNT